MHRPARSTPPWTVVVLLALLASACTDVGPTVSFPSPRVQGARVDGERREETSAALVVSTSSGAIRGKVDGKAMAFLGVPFAAPPVGSLRFRPPAPMPAWEGIRQTTTYGSVCSQIWMTGRVDGDEDCLYLNVWTPAAASGPRPVLFFVHGGGLFVGSAHQHLFFRGSGNVYDGRALAEQQGVVVVSTNYRLGQLGFLAHPALAAEDEHHSSGNYGTLDQIAALRWVHDNIASFGGDPNRVMVFGESAGGLSTCLLVASPLAKGLFSRALIESGGCTVATRESRNDQGIGLAAVAGCAASADVPACLRKRPARVFQRRPTFDASMFTMESALDDYRRFWEMTYGPNVDGWVLEESPYATLRAGRQSKVPLVVGTNANEFELLMPPIVNSCADYRTYISGSFGPVAPRVLERYPCHSYPLARHAVVDVFTDLAFTCTARRIARAALAGGSPAVFRYYFSHTFTNSPLTLLRSFHSSELPFVFDTFAVNDYTPAAGDRALSAAIGAYWATFAATGNPNHEGAPAWPAYDPSADDAIVLATPLSQTSGLATRRCDFWDRVGYAD